MAVLHASAVNERVGGASLTLEAREAERLGRAILHSSYRRLYHQYLSHARNSISRHMLPEGKPEETAGSLATFCQGEVDATTCNDSDEPETDDDVELEDAE